MKTEAKELSLVVRQDIKPHVCKLLPKGEADWPAFEVALRSAITKDDIDPKGGKLRAAMQNNPQGAMLAVVKAAHMGMDLNPAMEHGALIAYGNDIQWQPMFRGYIHLMRQSDQLEAIEADVVYRQEYDSKQPMKLPSGAVNHQPHVFERDAYKVEDVIGAYAWAKLKNVDRIVSVFVGRARLDQLRAMSKAPNSPAWREHPIAMMRAKAVKALARTGFVPLSKRAQEILRTEDDDEPVPVTAAVAPMAVLPGPGATLPADWDAGTKRQFEELDKEPLPKNDADVEREARAALAQFIDTEKLPSNEFRIVSMHLFKKHKAIDEMTKAECEQMVAYLRGEKQ